MIGTKKTIAIVGGAAALAFAVGFGGVGVSSLGSTMTPTTHHAASVAPAPAQGTAPDVHNATLSGIAFGGNPVRPVPHPHPHSH